jgi:hypothetical protein
MAVFLGTSVKTRPLLWHGKEWTEWGEHVSTLPGAHDPFLFRYANKAFLLATFFKARYERGLRGKAATEAGASVRIHFEIALHSADFYDAPMVIERMQNEHRWTEDLPAKRKEKLGKTTCVGGTD